MEERGIEQRTCLRFRIPGATVSFQIKGHSEESSPLLDISRGGAKFQRIQSIDLNTEVTLKISIPGETVPLALSGVVRWTFFDEAKSKYRIGIQFHPYGDKKGQNYPGNLVKIIALEQKFAPKEKSDVEKYEVD